MASIIDDTIIVLKFSNRSEDKLFSETAEQKKIFATFFQHAATERLTEYKMTTVSLTLDPGQKHVEI